MLFTERLREPVRQGEITTTVRIWKKPRVKVGNRYAMEGGYVCVDRIHEMSFDDITPTMARNSGFAGVADLLRTARHGKGERVFYIEFHFEDH